MQVQKFDVFLCHNSGDKDEVIEIGLQLRQRGLNPWLDRWELRPGEDLQDVLDEQIEHIQTTAVFVGKVGIGPWQRQEIKVFLRRFADQGYPIFPVILPSAPQELELPTFLKGGTWVDFRKSNPDPFEQLVWGVTGKKPVSFSRVESLEKTKGVVAQPILLNFEKVELLKGSANLNYEEKLKIYRSALQECIAQGEKITLDTVQESMLACRSHLMLTLENVKDIEFEVLGTTLETRTATVKELGTTLETRTATVEEAESEIPYGASDELDSEEVRRAMEDLQKRLRQAKGKSFTFLLVGKTGVGKSSTINSLMDAEVAPVGDFDPCTTNVNILETNLHGATVRVIDTPGLCDDLEEVGNDDKYIDLIRQRVSYPIDAVLFVTKLDDSRVDASEKRGLRILTEAFGELFWGKSVIVFTRSDKVSSARFEEFLRERTKRIHAALSELKVSRETVYSIPSVAVDNTDIEKVDPDGEKWIKRFYLTVLDRVEDDTKSVLLLSTSHTLEKRGISPLRVASMAAMAGTGVVSSLYPAAAIASMLGIGASSASVGTAVSGTGSVVFTGLFAFSNPVGWAFILGTAAAVGGLSAVAIGGLPYDRAVNKK